MHPGGRDVELVFRDGNTVTFNASFLYDADKTQGMARTSIRALAVPRPAVKSLSVRDHELVMEWAGEASSTPPSQIPALWLAMMGPIAAKKNVVLAEAARKSLFREHWVALDGQQPPPTVQWDSIMDDNEAADETVMDVESRGLVRVLGAPPIEFDNEYEGRDTLIVKLLKRLYGGLLDLIYM